MLIGPMGEERIVIVASRVVGRTDGQSAKPQQFASYHLRCRISIPTKLISKSSISMTMTSRPWLRPDSRRLIDASSSSACKIWLGTDRAGIKRVLICVIAA